MSFDHQSCEHVLQTDPNLLHYQIRARNRLCRSRQVPSVVEFALIDLCCLIYRYLSERRTWRLEKFSTDCQMLHVSLPFVCLATSGKLNSGMVRSAISLSSKVIANSGLEPVKAASQELIPLGCVIGLVITFLVIFRDILEPEKPANTPSYLSPAFVMKTT